MQFSLFLHLPHPLLQVHNFVVLNSRYPIYKVIDKKDRGSLPKVALAKFRISQILH